jgi:hypothetical protein
MVGEKDEKQSTVNKICRRVVLQQMCERKSELVVCQQLFAKFRPNKRNSEASLATSLHLFHGDAISRRVRVRVTE